MAAILADRKLAQYDGGKRVPATVAAIADSVRWAEEILKAIDERWPDSKSKSSLTQVAKSTVRYYDLLFLPSSLGTTMCVGDSYARTKG
jgi:hypothetical protein